mmetsp:Transcript_33904/g.79115  ORF Transcript_33904/g.79115 Transcript_33904/m.79115 type:complete len:345 (-) Transcript_33904:396-1430(-)
MPCSGRRPRSASSSSTRSTLPMEFALCTWPSAPPPTSTPPKKAASSCLSGTAAPRSSFFFETPAQCAQVLAQSQDNQAADTPHRLLPLPFNAHSPIFLNPPLSLRPAIVPPRDPSPPRLPKASLVFFSLPRDVMRRLARIYGTADLAQLNEAVRDAFAADGAKVIRVCLSPGARPGTVNPSKGIRMDFEDIDAANHFLHLFNEGTEKGTLASLGPLFCSRDHSLSPLLPHPLTVEIYYNLTSLVPRRPTASRSPALLPTPRGPPSPQSSAVVPSLQTIQSQVAAIESRVEAKVDAKLAQLNNRLAAVEQDTGTFRAKIDMLDTNVRKILELLSQHHGSPGSPGA